MMVRIPSSAPLKLAAGAALTGFCALSVHVIMLEWLGVPYPHHAPNAGLLPFLSEAALTLTTICFWWSVSGRLAAWPMLARCIFLFVLLGMLREQLIRKPTMESVVTTAWAHAFIANIPELVPFLVVAGLCVPLAPWLRTGGAKIAGAVLIAAFAFGLAGPAFEHAFRPVLSSIAGLDHGEVCAHGPCVEIPAYLTFAEPVAASFIVAALIWKRLSRRPAIRVLQFVLLLMTMDMAFFRPLLYGALGPMGFWPGVLSAGQFWLEHLVLGIGTAVIWGRFGEPAAPPMRIL